MNSHCFPAFLAIPPAQFKLVLDSIIWAFKHTMRNVADTGLQILYTLLQNVAQEEAAAQSFYQTYFCDILQHIFSVVTDTSHTAGEFSTTPGLWRCLLQTGGAGVVQGCVSASWKLVGTSGWIFLSLFFSFGRNEEFVFQVQLRTLPMFRGEGGVFEVVFSDVGTGLLAQLSNRNGPAVAILLLESLSPPVL